MGDRLLKFVVTVLCGINAVMWLLYTQSPVMAGLWFATAMAFFGWMVDDTRRA